MFGFIFKKLFIALLSACTIGSFGASLASNCKKPLKFLSLNNQPCQTRYINSDEFLFYLFTVSVGKWGESCNTNDDPYVRVCVRKKATNMNVKVFYLMSGVNETRFLVQHESCECKCGLNESVCNSKQKWDYDECRCECKELNNWGFCEKYYMWNLSACDCGCNKGRRIDEYLDIKNCSCEKRPMWRWKIK